MPLLTPNPGDAADNDDNSKCIIIDTFSIVSL